MAVKKKMSIQLSSALTVRPSVHLSIHPSISFLLFKLSLILPPQNFCPFQPLSPSQDKLATSSREQSLSLDLVPLKLYGPHMATTGTMSLTRQGSYGALLHFWPWCFLRSIPVPLPSSAHPWLVHGLLPTWCQSTLLTPNILILSWIKGVGFAMR